MRMGNSCVACVIIAYLLNVGSSVTGQTVTNVWTGGGGNNNWFDENNWSESTYPAGGQAVIIDSTYATAYTNVLLTNSTAWLDSFVISNRMLTFSNWNTALNATNVTVYSSGVLTLPSAFTSNQMSNQIYIACANFVLHEGGSINADAGGYAGGYNTTNGWGPGGGIAANSRGGGGGYGGKGGRGSNLGSDGGITNGVANAPAIPGSGGGGSTDGGGPYYGGAGGGLVTIQSSGGVTINGTVTANGARGETRAGSGSGGGINIECHTFGGTSAGLLSAAGGAGGARAGTDRYDGGAGGGGRIAVKYTDIAVPCAVRFSTEHGINNPTHSFDSWDARAQQKGTIYFPDSKLLDARVADAGGVLQGINGEILMAGGITSWGVNTLAISNAAWVGFSGFTVTITNGLTIHMDSALALRGGTLNSPGDLTITNKGALHVFAAPTNGPNPSYGALVTVGGTMQISPNGWVYPYADATNGASPLFQVGALEIAAGGGIDANRKGYIGGFDTSNGWGPGGGIAANGRGGGGGHGGKGGRANVVDSDGGIKNDAANAPALPGSGGGGSVQDGGSYGGRGGGLVTIQSSGGVTINGTVTANGARGETRAGGGAGGGINIECQTFGGSSTGLLIADGGAGGNSAGTDPKDGGAGGGGRIAVKYTDVGVPCAVRFSVESGINRVGYSFDSWDLRAPRKGTIYFPDSELLNARVAEAGGILQGINGMLRLATGITNWGVNTLTISNADWVGFEDFALTVTNGLTIQANGALAVHGGVLSTPGYLTITNGGQLHVFAAPTNGLNPSYGALVTVGETMQITSNGWVYAYADSTNGASPLFQVGDLNIASGGGIEANGKGYAAGDRETGGHGIGGGVWTGSRGSGAGHGGKGGGGGLIAVWVDVSDAVRSQYVAGNTNQVIRDATNTFFTGTLSVTNGLGFYTDPSEGGAESGIAYFYTPKPIRGSMILFR